MKKLCIAFFLGSCIAAEQKSLPGHGVSDVGFLLESDEVRVNSGIEGYIKTIEDNKAAILDEGEEYSEASYGVLLGCHLYGVIIGNEQANKALQDRDRKFIHNLTLLAARFKGQNLFDVYDIGNFFKGVLKFSDGEIQGNASIQRCLTDVVDQLNATTLAERGRVGATRKGSVSAAVSTNRPRLGSSRFARALAKKVEQKSSLDGQGAAEAQDGSDDE